jgi:hypothetical protein
MTIAACRWSSGHIEVWGRDRYGPSPASACRAREASICLPAPAQLILAVQSADMHVDTLAEFAGLIRSRNAIDPRISAIIGRPAVSSPMPFSYAAGVSRRIEGFSLWRMSMSVSRLTRWFFSLGRLAVRGCVRVRRAGLSRWDAPDSPENVAAFGRLIVGSNLVDLHRVDRRAVPANAPSNSAPTSGSTPEASICGTDVGVRPTDESICTDRESLELRSHVQGLYASAGDWR